MKRLAVFIVEDRELNNVGKLVYNQMKFLPKEADLFVFTKPSLYKLYEQKLNEVGLTARFNEFGTYEAPSHFHKIVGFNDLIKSKNTMSRLLDYCLLLTSSSFWKNFITYERVLCIQTDTELFREGVEEFMEWDWVGAPCYNFVNDQTIQNGGLSLRNPRIMDYICTNYGWDTDLEELIAAGASAPANFFAEDIFFCVKMIKYGIGNYAPLEVAKKFSVELQLEWGTFGGHQLNVYHSSEIVKKLRNQYK